MPKDTDSELIDVPRFPVTRLQAWGKALGWTKVSYSLLSRHFHDTVKDVSSDLIPEYQPTYQAGHKLGVLVANLGDYKTVRIAVDAMFDLNRSDLWFWFGVADGVLYFYSDSYKP